MLRLHVVSSDSLNN